MLSLPVDIRLGWKGMAMINTTAYYDTTTITAIKNFIVQEAPSAFKSIMILNWQSLEINLHQKSFNLKTKDQFYKTFSS